MKNLLLLLNQHLKNLFPKSFAARLAYRQWQTRKKEYDYWFRQGKYDRALAAARKALTVAQRATGAAYSDRALATSLMDLAALHYSQGEYASAESQYNQALAILEKALGPDHPDVGHCLHHLARLYAAQNLQAKAQPLFRRAQEIAEKSRE